MIPREFLSWSRRVLKWRMILIAIDLAVAALAYAVLMFVLLDIASVRLGLLHILAAVIFSVPALLLVGAHRQLWRRVSLVHLIALLGAALMVSISVACGSLVVYTADVSVRIFIGSVIVLLAAWSAPRLLVRMWREWQEANAATGPVGEPIILYGSGARAEMFLRSNQESKRYKIVGFLHEDRRLEGVKLRGVESFGGLENLPRLLAHSQRLGLQPKRLVISEDSEQPDELRAALEAAAANGLRLSRLPSMLGLVEGVAGLVRSVSIDDILHREQVRLNDPRVPQVIKGAVVLVTGAGGSIGSELVRQISCLAPKRIVLVEVSEYNLYRMHSELERTFPHVPCVTALCDVRAKEALRSVFKLHKPQIVLHAAALKHVPLLEDHAAEAVLTNIMGTHNVASVAVEHAVEVMTLVSTDKAVNPTNVMGCTKRWAEMICQSFDSRRQAGKISTRFVCVRFGNVLDSAGSVVPLFREQIAMGGPVTVTDRDITRYFMTIPEACELILTATAATQTQEPPDSHVYVLDMGEPIRIMSLAERMIQLHGLRPGDDIAIQVTGLRRGEKLHEELAHEQEQLLPAPIDKANLVPSRAPDFEIIEKALKRLTAAVSTRQHTKIVRELNTLVPEYKPTASVVESCEEEPSVIHHLNDEGDIQEAS